MESDGRGGGGWRCVVTGRERHDSFILFSLPQPPQRKKAEGGWGEKNEFTRGVCTFRYPVYLRAVEAKQSASAASELQFKRRVILAYPASSSSV